MPVSLPKQNVSLANAAWPLVGRRREKERRVRLVLCEAARSQRYDRHKRRRARARLRGGMIPTLENIPPHSPEAEASALGGMIAEPKSAAIAIEFLKPEDFYIKHHAAFFTILVDMIARGVRLDELTVRDRLQQSGKLGLIGGEDVLGRLVHETPNAANIEAYCRIIKDRKIQRDLITAAATILQRVQDPGGHDGAALLEMARGLVDAAGRNEESKADTPKAPRHVSEVMREALAKQTPRIPTGYAEWDAALDGGFVPGMFGVLAALTSDGKSTIALNLLIALAYRLPVALVTLEDSAAVVAFKATLADVQRSASTNHDGRTLRRGTGTGFARGASQH